MANPPMPLSKSASASHVISMPSPAFAEMRTRDGSGGGVVSATVPVFTYCIQAFATTSFGSHTASFGLPLLRRRGLSRISHQRSQPRLRCVGWPQGLVLAALRGQPHSHHGVKKRNRQEIGRAHV